VVLNLPTIDDRALRRISRPAAATTAVGTHKVHEREQAGLVASAFA
jgi:multifunctional 2-oxoglutarate metabolism enzyme